MTILARIRAQGGDVVRDGWSIRLRPGRLTPAALAWLRDHRADLMHEVWPAFDAFEERAAIRQFMGGETRADAEAAAYLEVGP